MLKTLVLDFRGFAQCISHVLVCFIIDKLLVLAVFRMSQVLVLGLRPLLQFSCLVKNGVCHYSALHLVPCFYVMYRRFSCVTNVSRSLITWPRKDTAVLKPCCAWNQLTKKLMAVLYLLLARMHVPSIGWGSVRRSLLTFHSHILIWHASRYTKSLGRRQSRSVQGRPLPHYEHGAMLICGQPELRRVLWPLFVYSFLNMVTSFYPQEAKQFFDINKNLFLPEHTDDVRKLEPISLPEHVQDNSTAKLYRGNKYRIVLSNPAFANLMQFLENKSKEGGSVMSAILSSYCTIITKERASDDRFSFAAMLGQAGAGQTFPAEDEGIPGHHPGSAYTGDNPAMAGTLPRLRLGKLPMESTLETDVRGELADEDMKNPPAPGHNSLVQEFDQMIKKEEDDEAPSRADIPYPPSTARDVALEVQKVKENRERFRIEGRTGGVGPAVSVCMFTFHNTYDGWVMIVSLTGSFY